MEGIIRKIGIEGGVWALVIDDGSQIELIDAPAALLQNGARARVDLDEKRVDATIGMMGRSARVKSFELL